MATNYSKPIVKTGPNLSLPSESIDILKSMGFSCVTLANNHFRDFGYDACENTLVLLQAKEIDYVGAGRNLADAAKILYKYVNGVRVAFVNVCEQEWSIATETTPGSNPVNPLVQYNQIQEAKSNSDFVIVIHHGGIEHYQLPSPELKRLHRFFIDVGADAVINHHQHCFSGYEVYRDRPIFYGLGNFIFDDSRKANSIWNYGYMVELNLDSTEGGVSFKLYPYEQCNGFVGIKMRKDIDAFEHEVSDLNRIIADDELLKKSWRDYAERTEAFYSPAIIPFRSRVINKLISMHLFPVAVSKYQMRYLCDVIRCDSHRTRFIEYLKDLI